MGFWVISDVFLQLLCLLAALFDAGDVFLQVCAIDSTHSWGLQLILVSQQPEIPQLPKIHIPVQRSSIFRHIAKLQIP